MAEGIYGSRAARSNLPGIFVEHEFSFTGVRTLGHRSYESRTQWWHTLEFTACLLACLFLGLLSASAQTDYSHAWAGFSKQEAAKGRPVRVHGTVLCYDHAWGQFYLHDAGDTVYLNPLWFTNRFEVGQQIEIQAHTAWDGNSPALTNAVVKIHGRGSLPNPTRLKMGELGKQYGQWVEISGWVRVAETSQGRVTMVLKDGAQPCVVYVMGTTENSPFRYLQDSWVSVRGINASRIEKGKLVSASLFVPNLGMVKVLKPGERDRWKLPITPIDTLLTKPLGDWTNHPVRLSGLIDSYEPGARLTFHDPTGTLEAEVLQIITANPGQRVELWGFLGARSNRTVLADAYFELTGNAARTETPETVARRAPEGPLITNAREIRRMSREEANEGHAVRLPRRADLRRPLMARGLPANRR